MTQLKTADEKRYHDYLANQPCIACGDRPCTVHHVRYSAGIGQRSSHYMALSLCDPCHQGPAGIHFDRKVFEMRWGTEEQLLAKQIERMWVDANSPR